MLNLQISIQLIEFAYPINNLYALPKQKENKHKLTYQ